MTHSEERFMLAVGVLSALLIASHDQATVDLSSPVAVYAYSAARIGVQALLFFAARALVERYAPHWRFSTTTAVAILGSHIPFVLAVTTIDIVIGRPELGLLPGAAGPASGLSAFSWELLYLADNHIALCLLLSVPRLALQRSPQTVETPPPTTATLLSVIEPPLRGTVLWVEAQEHYVRITTSEESRLILARFSDIVRELAHRPGLQVHRSHWVLTEAVVETRKTAQSLNLLLVNGDTVPVSRTYRQQVEAVFPSASTTPA